MRQTWWLHFSKSQLPIHHKEYVSSISVYSLHFTTRTCVRYTRTCSQCRYFMERAQTLTHRLLLQAYLVRRWKSLQQNVYGWHLSNYKSFPFYLDLFSFQNHGQDFSKTWGLVVSMLLVFSVFCVLFFFDHCIVCPMWPVSMNCPFCCFLRFIFINYTSEWVIVDYRHISNFNLYYCENKLHSIRWYWCSICELHQHD